MGVFEHFPYTNFHDLNLDWILQTVKAAVAELAAYEGSVNAKLAAQDLKIDEYKAEFEAIVEDYKTALENEMETNRNVVEDLYKRTLDVYNKTLLQIEVMKQYVDNAISDFGSIAQWSIVNDELTATVFNDGILISIGMTADGRLEVTTDA